MNFLLTSITTAKWVEMYLVLAAVSAASALLTWIAFRAMGGAGLPGCSDGSPCSSVMASRWSKWGFVPVAGLGAAIYLALAFIVGYELTTGEQSGLLQDTILCLLLMVIGAALWFIFIQLAIVHRFCGYCNAVHLLGVLGFMFAMPWLGRVEHEFFAAAAIAGVCLAVLIVGQFVLPYREYAVARVASVEAGTSAASPETVIEAGNLTNHTSPVAIDRSLLPHRIALLDGRVRLDTRQWPVVGSPQGKRLAAFVFDYTCDACRVVHQIVNETVEADRELSILFIPLPQHPGCNAEIKEIHAGREFACQYARLTIALWHLCPDEFSEFDRFLATRDKPPPLGLAIERARELVSLAINPHQPDEKIDQMIGRSVGIYRSLPVKKIPSLLLPHGQVAGQLRSVAEFKALLEREFRPRSPRKHLPVRPATSGR